MKEENLMIHVVQKSFEKIELIQFGMRFELRYKKMKQILLQYHFVLQRLFALIYRQYERKNRKNSNGTIKESKYLVVWICLCL